MTGWTTNPSHPWISIAEDVMFGSYDARNGSGTGDCGGVDSCLNPATGAYLYQNLATVVGQEYDVSFEYYFAGSSGLQVLDAYFGSTEIANISTTTNTPHWILYSTSVVAASATTKLNFVQGNDPSFTFLDNVSVTAATPEPAAWMTLCAAFSLLFARRFRFKPER